MPKSLGLQAGDKIKSLNAKPVKTLKVFIKNLSSFEIGGEIFLVITRKNKQYLLNYKIIGKNKYKLIKKTDFIKSLMKNPKKNKKIKRSNRNTFKTNRKNKLKKKPSDNPKKNISSKKKPLPKRASLKNGILNRYRKHLQEAYIISPMSFIYKTPHFDSKQLFHLREGDQIIVSKKVFTPAHRFGTFYKAFIKSPKKVVGYVSEIEVIPEFVQQSDKKYEKNTCYNKIKTQIAKKGQFNLNSLSGRDFVCAGGSKPVTITPKNIFSKSGDRHVGFSVSGMSSLFKFRNIPERYEPMLGVKLSGKRLLIPYIDMDINLAINYDLNEVYGDLLVGYPVIGSDTFVIYPLLGFNFNYHLQKKPSNTEVTSRDTQVTNYSIGPVAGLSVVLPVQNIWAVRGDVKINYGLVSKKGQSLFTISLQRMF